MEKNGAQQRLILLVDDEPSILQYFTMVLERAGYQLILASDGKDAMEKFTKFADQLDLVIMDHHMPHMTGQEATSLMRSQKPHIPILLSSGDSATNSTSTIRKPISPNELVATVRDILV